ncbi:FAD-binding oxidoreductase [Sporolituus thermophilus]|uniref:Glycolate oxidase n=1 Tax=Sporolituus thermophilus DSM 23256 TaxID=1123285 RepID=A0A1G7J518_9FIRM|nr:FAD-linked oxidase C-terminal domain-containing protein [Sporolituus thermophilus]SDF20020.1 glycolate oxidase [Sporolituus thermophilus DSM 23256]
MEPRIIKALAEIVGRENVLTSPEELICYGYDATPGFSRLPEVVVRPGNKKEVSRVLALANREKIPVYTRGSGTNLSAGVVPMDGGIVLSTVRMNSILEIDPENFIAVVEPGVIVAELNAAVEKYGLIYPPDPGTVTTASMGGTVAENSGGLRGLKYGVTKHYVLGLEVVLADGQIAEFGGRTLRSPGYDMVMLFTGSEGTLGVITKIIVRLVPAPTHRKSMIAVFHDLNGAGKSIADIIGHKIIPATLEIMDNYTIRTVESFVKLGLPVEAEAIILAEVDGDEATVAQDAAKMEKILRENGGQVRVATSAQERDQIWAARRAALPSLAKLRPSTFCEDATVPRSKVPDMVRRITEIAQKYDVQIGTFGHAGDGNLHPTLVSDLRNNTEMERVYQAMDEIFLTALELDGTLSGEHGIGLGKLKYMPAQFGEVGLDVMRAIKKALDPNGILNPGKLVGQLQ